MAYTTELRFNFGYAINIRKLSEMAVKQLHQMDPSKAICYTKIKPKFSNLKHKPQQKSHVKNCKYCRTTTQLEIATHMGKLM